MATKRLIKLETSCDICGGEGTTQAFEINGEKLEIDVCHSDRAILAKAVAKFRAPGQEPGVEEVIVADLSPERGYSRRRKVGCTVGDCTWTGLKNNRFTHARRVHAMDAKDIGWREISE